RSSPSVAAPEPAWRATPSIASRATLHTCSCRSCPTSSKWKPALAPRCVSIDQPVIASHPIGQQPDRLIAFGQIVAAVEQEGCVVPFVNEAFRPALRFGARWVERGAEGVL